MNIGSIILFGRPNGEYRDWETKIQIGRAHV